MKKILVVDDESGIGLTVNLDDVRDVYRHVCDILIQRVSMDSPHDHIIINIKDQLKDYIDKCLTRAGGARTRTREMSHSGIILGHRWIRTVVPV